MLKKVIRKTHLWLGLSSGLVVFIVAITGCLYAFQFEIKNWLYDYIHVAPQQLEILPPSKIKEIADQQLPGKHLHGVQYLGTDKSAKAIYYSFAEKYYYFVYVNPYSGDVLKVKNEYADFFRIVLDGHFYLWLPPNIGQPLVASFTLIFLIMIISGLFLWWPRKRKGREKSFKIKWNARWRRKNYDLHSVIGFYVAFVAIIFALTGLVWGFEWFRDGLHATVGGNKSLEYVAPNSQIDFSKGTVTNPVDLLWERTVAQYPQAASIEAHFPDNEQAPILMEVNHEVDTYWKMDYLYYDQYSLKQLEVDHIYGQLKNANSADKLIRMNYDIHTGAILGFGGKLFAFLCSLLIATLPVTGFLIWIGRRNKTRNRKSHSVKVVS